MLRALRTVASAAVTTLFAIILLTSQPALAADALTPAVAAFQHAVASLDGDVPTVTEVQPAAPLPLSALVAAHAAGLVVDDEQECLANAVYFEARGEPLEGQLAVAEVVLNRSRSGRYPPTICGVVTQRAQFSFVRRGVMPRADRSSEAWRRAVAIANIAQGGGMRLLSDDVLWYHATYVSPSWGRRLARTTQIGLHIFYS
jgi:spore germination cell wall hydrolase CwlJ-like protein